MASFILWWFFLPRGGFLHSACAQGLNDNDATFLRIRLQFLECFTLPRPLISLGCAEPASPKGSFCTVLLDVGFIDTPQESSKKPSPTGKGDRPQAVDEGRYGVVHCRNNGRRGRNVSTDSPTVSGMFHVVPPSSVRAAPCQLPRRGSSCTVPLGVGFIDTPQESSKKPSPTGKGDRPQAVDEGRYGVVHCRNNGRRGRNVSTDSPTVSGMFQAAPPPHQSGLRPASFPGGEALVPGLGGGRYRTR